MTACPLPHLRRLHRGNGELQAQRIDLHQRHHRRRRLHVLAERHAPVGHEAGERRRHDHVARGLLGLRQLCPGLQQRRARRVHVLLRRLGLGAGLVNDRPGDVARGQQRAVPLGGRVRQRVLRLGQADRRLGFQHSGARLFKAEICVNALEADQYLPGADELPHVHGRRHHAPRCFGRHV